MDLDKIYRNTLLYQKWADMAFRQLLDKALLRGDLDYDNLRRARCAVPIFLGNDEYSWHEIPMLSNDVLVDYGIHYGKTKFGSEPHVEPEIKACVQCGEWGAAWKCLCPKQTKHAQDCYTCGKPGEKRMMCAECRVLYLEER